MSDKNTQRVKKLTSIIKEKGSRHETDRAKAGDLEYFWAWVDLAYGQQESYPVDPSILLDFIASHLEGNFPDDIDNKLVAKKIKASLGPHKLSTIRRRISTLSWKHKELGFNGEKNPTMNAQVADLLKSAANDSENRSLASKAAVKRILDQVIESINGDDLHSIRDRALILLTWQSGRRRSETVGMKLEHRISSVRDTPECPGYYIFEFPHLKNRSRTETALTIKIGGRAKEALDRWLEAAGISTGHIFRGVSKGGKTVLEKPISGTQVYRIVKKRFLEAGIEDWEMFTPHSFRSGFVTELGKRNKSVGDGMAMTGHKSLQTFMSYYQQGGAETNTAADMLDE
ncbi:MAG: hypothetical protein C9356_15855 [Oleiphilus sp.]|nr:MAG: hypothetical protein C9356_15855 [Oleiphilus sp.]